MTKYKCGHKTNGVIILDDNILSMMAYFDLANGVGLKGDKSMCWNCYCKESNHNQESPRVEKLVEGDSKISPIQTTETTKGVSVENTSPTHTDNDYLKMGNKE